MLGTHGGWRPACRPCAQPFSHGALHIESMRGTLTPPHATTVSASA
ncbi:hypothetical protein COLSTE_00867 [Collinsella stercoris DSM 13279]|uniref:Uncharacterized protein n=1 Tax=Collinsella stercoris DSM 13279 TaxID=445975 RepID=B6G9X6_9ACTN|nr:hypothetical protein COLSTE_00867 [Collinsella stercoris DSM 13279]